MRKYFISILIIFFSHIQANGQSTYTMANFANSGDTFYYTKAQNGLYNFDTSGTNVTWNFASLAGVSQRRLLYRLPTQTGYSALQWPYLYNANNVNLSSTDEQTTAIFGLQQTNPNDYFLKNNNLLREKASAYTLVLNGIPVNVKNVYNNADTIYTFPLQNNSTNKSRASYTVNIPGVYYRNVFINRKDTVKGWGTVITPYKTFSNTLQLVSNLLEVDSIALNGQPLVTNDSFQYREIKWFDPSQKNPVLQVKQTKTGNVYLTTSIEYLDVQQYYQPTAMFAYLPVAPNAGDTISFQNLSQSALLYKWNFADGTDSSTAINPQHIFTTAGTYAVQLIAYNGSLTDTVVIPIKVNPVNQTYTFVGNGNWDDPANWSNNMLPPATLPSSNQIVINHAIGGQCVLNIAQRIESGANLIINTGKNLVIQGNFRIQ